MVKQNNPTWEQFECNHPDENSRRTVFENLCRAIFKRKYFKENTVLHSNPNHPGVEIEPIYSEVETAHISFQAKYFDNKIDYEQIKKSAEITVRNYNSPLPKLDKLFLFCNKDINTSNKAYKKIKSELMSANIDLVPFTGQSILDEVINYLPVLNYYFGVKKLDNNWIRENIELSLDQLGKRYNKKFNVYNNSEELFAIFVQSKLCVSILNQRKNKIISDLIKNSNGLPTRERLLIQPMISKIKEINDITESSIADALSWDQIFNDNKPKDLKQYIQNIQEEYNKKTEVQTQENNERHSRSELFTTIHKLNNIQETCFLSPLEKNLISSQILILTGEMGVGKSQTLAYFANELSNEQKFVILVLGQSINSTEPIRIQITNNLINFPPDYNLEFLIPVMEEFAYNNNTYSYLFIDAINESNNRQIWQDGVRTLEHLLKNFHRVKLVVSVRNGFEKECLGDYLTTDKVAHINHRGFEDIESVYEFLTQEQNIISPELYLRKETYNPLFLTWFCQAFSNNKTKKYASLIDSILSMADTEASYKCKSSEPYEIIEDLLFEFIKLKKKDSKNFITRRDLISLEIWDKYKVQYPLDYIKSLESSGILCSYKLEEQKNYYIGYNLLDEYLQAKLIISLANNKNQILHFASDLLKEPFYENISVFCMLTSLYAAKYNEECIYLIDNLEDETKSEIIDKYFETLAMRDADISIDQFKHLLSKYSISQSVLWLPFIANPTKVNWSLNARGLHNILINLKLNERDYLWTTYINELTHDDRIVNIINHIVKGDIFHEITIEQVELLLILFTWFLSSSNRILRDITSKAMIEILKNQLSFCCNLLELFKNVDDPYILQRLYGVIFGAVIKRKNLDKKTFSSLTLYIFNDIFNKETVYPDILLRDYARLIIERYEYEFPGELSLEIMNKTRPPYKSEAIPATPQIKEPVSNNKPSYIKGVSEIFFSMRPDIHGLYYGDFGRYIFQNALNNFYQVDVENAYNYALNFIFNILEYSEDKFGSYDSFVAKRKYEGRWVERIGKKYQWIAFYNILARVSDFYEITAYGLPKESYPYTGAWELTIRDFDPTINMEYPKNIASPKFTNNNALVIPPESYNLNSEQAGNWVKDFTSIEDYVPHCLIREDNGKRQWINLHFSRKNTSKSDGSNEYYPAQKGTQYAEIFSTAYLIPKQGKLSIDEIKSSRYFETHHNTIRQCYSLFNREYSWSPGYGCQFNDPRVADIDPNGIIPACINYLWEAHFDASQELPTSFLIPHGVIISGLNLHQNDVDGIYYFNNELVSFDLSIFNPNNDCELLIRKDYLDKFLETYNYDLIWDISIEKRYHTDTNDFEYHVLKKIGTYKNGTIYIENIEPLENENLENKI